MPTLPNLRAIRESRFLSQAMLADRSGVSRPAIQRLEGGDVEARYITIQKLAAALGVEPGDLVGWAFAAGDRVRLRDGVVETCREPHTEPVMRGLGPVPTSVVGVRVGHRPEEAGAEGEVVDVIPGHGSHAYLVRFDTPIRFAGTTAPRRALYYAANELEQIGGNTQVEEERG